LKRKSSKRSSWDAFSDDDYVRTPLAARLCQSPEQTLRWLRHKRRGPVYTRMSGRILYRIGDLKTYLLRNAVSPEKE